MSETLADIVAYLDDRHDLPLQQRRNMMSAIRALCRVIDRPLERIPAGAARLEEVLRAARPGVVGLSRSRWGNVKSDVRKAIRIAKRPERPDKASDCLPNTWEQVIALTNQTAQRSILRRFGCFCGELGIPPEQVTDETVAQYLAFLTADNRSKVPLRSAKDLIRTWNRVAAPANGGPFAKLDPRSQSRGYTPSWSELPLGLAEDAKRYRLVSLQPQIMNDDIFSDRPRREPVRPSTADQRDRMLRRLAAAEIHAGVAANELNSLGDLVHPHQLKRGLGFFLERSGGKQNTQLSEMANLALLVAKYWAHLPSAEVATIEQWSRRFRRRQIGLSNKNRERLRQFVDQNVLRKLTALPYKLIDRARHQPVSYRSALAMQAAIAIAVLAVAPIRIGNLATLDRDRHFQWAFSPDKKQMHLVIPKAEVKNRVDLEYPISERLLDVIDDYMQHYQPLLSTGHANGLLFPGRKGGTSKTISKLRERIVSTIDREIGLEINPHLFRHLSALIFLSRYPGQYEAVRQLLGHRSVQTTINFYVGFETNEAMVRYDNLLQSLQSRGLSEDAAPLSRPVPVA